MTRLFSIGGSSIDERVSGVCGRNRLGGSVAITGVTAIMGENMENSIARGVSCCGLSIVVDMNCHVDGCGTARFHV